MPKKMFYVDPSLTLHDRKLEVLRALQMTIDAVTRCVDLESSEFSIAKEVQPDMFPESGAQHSVEGPWVRVSFNITLKRPPGVSR